MVLVHPVDYTPATPAKSYDPSRPLDTQSPLHQTQILCELYFKNFPNTAPSSQGVPSGFAQLQQDERHAIRWNRPHSATSSIPSTLLHPISVNSLTTARITNRHLTTTNLSGNCQWQCLDFLRMKRCELLSFVRSCEIWVSTHLRQRRCSIAWFPSCNNRGQERDRVSGRPTSRPGNIVLHPRN